MVIITLTGPGGVGKSTIGKKLAKKINFNFIDLDLVMNDRLKNRGGIQGFTKNLGDKYFIESGYKKEPCPWEKAWGDYMLVVKEFVVGELMNHIKNQNVVLDCGGGTIYSQFQA